MAALILALTAPIAFAVHAANRPPEPMPPLNAGVISKVYDEPDFRRIKRVMEPEASLVASFDDSIGHGLDWSAVWKELHQGTRAGIIHVASQCKEAHRAQPSTIAARFVPVKRAVTSTREIAVIYFSTMVPNDTIVSPPESATTE